MKALFKTTFLAASLCLLFNPIHANASAMTASEAVRFLNHATYGATTDDIKLVQRIGMDAWIYQQLKKKQCKHYNPATVADTLAERKHIRDEIWWTSAMVCDDQLRQRVALALSEILVVSDNNGTLARHQEGLESYYDTLITHSLGNFRDLLKAVSLHPTMGSYLNMRGNEKADPINNIRPDENYARELMQLFTIGLVNLNMDGTPVTTKTGATTPTYSQTDISELARVLTGWTWKGIDTKEKWDALKKRARPDIKQDYTSPMVALAVYHDAENKTLLGKNIQRNLSPEADLDRALDILFTHPNTAPFISKQLIQRLVKSNPSPAYVRRVASVFHNNGSRVRGDMAAVVRAILTDGEALSEQDKKGKLIEPMLRVTQLWRGFSATATDQYGHGYPFSLSTPDNSLGQSPLSAPSVFNFFEPAYAPALLKKAQLVAPEFQLVDSSLLPRLNNRLAVLALSGYIGSGRDPEGFSARLNYDTYLPLLAKPSELIEQLNTLLMSGRMDDSMRTVLLDFIKELQATKTPQRQIIAEVVHMIIISPQYAIQW